MNKGGREGGRNEGRKEGGIPYVSEIETAISSCAQPFSFMLKRS